MGVWTVVRLLLSLFWHVEQAQVMHNEGDFATPTMQESGVGGYKIVSGAHRIILHPTTL